MSQPSILILSTGAYAAALDEITARFAAKTGTSCRILYDSAVSVGQRIAAGDAFDFAITSAAVAAGLGADLLEPPLREAGRNHVALGFRRGLPAPDVSSRDAVRQVLLNAPSLSFSDPVQGGASAQYLVQLLRELGILDEVLRKAVLAKPGQGAFPAGEGRAAYAIAQASEIAMVDGLSYVPVLPHEPAGATAYVGGLARGGANKAAARDFGAYLESGEARAIRAARGLG